MSIEIFCRLCAKKYYPYHLKTFDQLKHEHLDQLIFRYLHIKIDDNNNLPKMACLDCCNTVYNFNHFTQNVENAQKILEDIFLQQTQITDIKSEQYFVDDNRNLKEQQFQNNWFSNNLKDEHNTFDSYNSDFVESISEQKPKQENIVHNRIFENITDEPAVENHQTKSTNYKKKTLRNMLWKCYRCLVYYPSVIHLQKHFQNFHNAPIVEYNCTECNALFQNLQEFQNHMLHDHEIPFKRRSCPKFKCDICGFTASYSTTFKNHQYTHTGVKRFSCDQCGKRFTLKQQLEAHSVTHLRANNNIDDVNGANHFIKRKTTQNKKRRTIRKTEVPKRVLFKCYKCNNLLQSITHLEQHFHMTHENCEIHYQCPKCVKIYVNKEEFENHLKNEHKRKNKCDICGREFNHRTNLLAHYHTHTGIKRYSCDLCGKRFGYKQHAEVHRLKHNRATYNCNQCNKTCLTEHLLQRHLRTHLPKESKLQHECDICHKKFISLQGVLGHHKLMHEGENRFICEVCPKTFRFKSQCLAHSKIHTDEKPYKCPQCHKFFKSTVTLRRHLTSHTDIRPHACETCGSKFREKRMLTRHQKIHTGQLPFQCETCKKQFLRKYALKVHQRQHTGERPYSCLECNFHFSNSSNYLKHLKVRHGKKSTKEIVGSSRDTGGTGNMEDTIEQTQSSHITNL